MLVQEGNLLAVSAPGCTDYGEEIHTHARHLYALKQLPAGVLAMRIWLDT